MSELIESRWIGTKRYRRFRDSWNECGCSEVSEVVQIGDAIVCVCVDQGISKDWIRMTINDGDGRQRHIPCILNLEDVREKASLLSES